MAIELLGTGPHMHKYEYGTSRKPQWLKEFEAQRSPRVINGITYKEKAGARQCLIVRDYADLTDCAEDFSELLCMHSPGGVFIDLGDAPEGHDLIINAEGGKVYINGHTVIRVACLKSLGDSSWGIVYEDYPLERPKGILGQLIKLYDAWLNEVYEKCANLGLIEINRLHRKSIWFLFIDGLPKGEIISKKVLDK